MLCDFATCNKHGGATLVLELQLMSVPVVFRHIIAG